MGGLPQLPAGPHPFPGHGEAPRRPSSDTCPTPIAFSVERDWVRRFHELQVPPPVWYHPVFLPGYGGGWANTVRPGRRVRRWPGFPCRLPGGGGGLPGRRFQPRHHLGQPVRQPQQHVERADVSSHQHRFRSGRLRRGGWSAAGSVAASPAVVAAAGSARVGALR